MDKKVPLFTKADILLAVILLALGLGSMLLLRGGEGSTVVVTADGAEYGRWPLSQDITVTLETANGHNTMEIKGGQVSVTEADCPNGDCVEFGAISREGQMIICLPHHLVIMIENLEGGGVDAVSY
ncbi:MAG: NusG domain II-containing protein [Firmicutes bacterium]|nr:NusG domain II-containing protein [Bacillota bacterium]